MSEVGGVGFVWSVASHGGCTVLTVMSWHDAVALRSCSRVVSLRDGEVGSR